MKAVYVEHYKGCGEARNLPEGADEAAELEIAKAKNPGKNCFIISAQSFGSEPNGGPDSQLMPGY